MASGQDLIGGKNRDEHCRHFHRSLPAVRDVDGSRTRARVPGLEMAEGAEGLVFPAKQPDPEGEFQYDACHQEDDGSGDKTKEVADHGRTDESE